jgi:hypothetical protein
MHNILFYFFSYFPIFFHYSHNFLYFLFCITRYNLGVSSTFYEILDIKNFWNFLFFIFLYFFYENFISTPDYICRKKYMIFRRHNIVSYFFIFLFFIFFISIFLTLHNNLYIFLYFFIFFYNFFLFFYLLIFV